MTERQGAQPDRFEGALAVQMRRRLRAAAAEGGAFVASADEFGQVLEVPGVGVAAEV